MKLLCACLLLVSPFHLIAADTAPDISPQAFDAATALSKAGRDMEAAQAMQALVTARTQALGTEARETLLARLALLEIQTARRKDAAAEGQVQALLPILQRVLGAEDRQTLKGRQLLVYVRYQMRKYAEAEPECRSLITDMTRALGPQDAQTLAVRQVLARILYNQKKRPEAEQECRSLIADMTRMLGPEDAQTLAVRTEFAILLFYQKKLAEAVQEQRAILAIRERAPGAADKATLTTCHDLAVFLRALDQPQEALTMAQRALAGRLRLLGPDAADTDASQRLVNLLTYTAAAPGHAPGAGTAAAAAPQEPDPPVAMVDGALIRTSDLQAALQAQEPEIQQTYEHFKETTQALAELKRKTLGKLIDQQLLINEFLSTGATLKPQIMDDDIRRFIQERYQGDPTAFLAGLTKRGQTEETFRTQRRRMLILTVMRLRLSDEVQITLQEARDYYENHKDRWAGDAEVKIRTLTLPKNPEQPEDETRRQAQGLRTRILAGADFAATARTHSQDSHAENGGAWDWTPVADLTAPVRDAVLKTKTGGISELIEQGSHFILLRVDDYRAPETPPFEKVQEDIARLLKKEKTQERVKAQTDQLRHEADIQMLAPAKI